MDTSEDAGSMPSSEDAKANTNIPEAVPGEGKGKAGPSGVRKRKSPPSRNSPKDKNDDNNNDGDEDAKLNDGEQVRESKRPRRERRMSFAPCDRMTMTADVKDMVKAIPEGEYLKMVEAIKTLASLDPQTSVSYRSSYGRCAMY